MMRELNKRRITTLIALLAGGTLTAQTITFSVPLEGAQEVPPVASPGSGTATVVLDTAAMNVTVSGSYSNLSANATAAHIHGLAAAGANAGVLVSLTETGGTSGTISGSGSLTAAQVQGMIEGQTYINLHTTAFTGGEIRGQICINASAAMRNPGATNPSSYTINGSNGGNPVIGGTVSLFVNASGTTGHTNSTVLGYLGSLTTTLMGGQELLMDVGHPAGDLLGLGLQGGDTNIVGAPVPNDLSLCGLTIYTQGVHILGIQPFALSNAVDFTIGV